MPEGGGLRIETFCIHINDPDEVQIKDLNPGPYVAVEISDTGTGMDAEVFQHLFEPFFTTKPKGKGTGLGLATSYGIVKQHGGNIRVYSESEKGSVFRIYLPAAFEAPAELHQESKPRCVRGGSETILIAEDDLQVRRLTTVILKEQGYRVLAAENAEAAISLANNHPGPIHLILTDIIMSDMNGKQLFEKVSTISPDIRVLYMSGYAGDVIA